MSDVVVTVVLMVVLSGCLSHMASRGLSKNFELKILKSTPTPGLPIHWNLWCERKPD